MRREQETEQEQTMKERPIIFNGDMVRAILEGRKTQTRRPMKPQPPHNEQNRYPSDWLNFQTKSGRFIHSEFGLPGDRLWVRETWHYFGGNNFSESPGFVSYRADGEFTTPGNKWRPSIHMPRWASRIVLEITNVRIERAQEITTADAIAEGWQFNPGSNSLYPPYWFAGLWNVLYNNKGLGWDTNPWVWVIEFRVLEPVT